jgi:hypothetical protein
LQRPIQLLYSLEVPCPGQKIGPEDGTRLEDQGVAEHPVKETKEVQESTMARRPRRAAAAQAQD